ncbi:MAG: M1 family peptidase, partial [Flavobacteriaceae bacterium]|nr:M1 family peptidase [Flavobacteriaceae bacterium]
MNKLHQVVFFLSLILSVQTSNAQTADGYWQQHVNYTMDVDMNVKNYQYTGSQTLVYTNNSPDTLHQVFYHLYFNAFQPGSEMDVRSRTIRDADARVA